ncbi:hypothetical protein [Catenuloplanes atrovinosus]|uniref:Uncharacterized protein n=1 Tax=Catenuloplanes atrovinosus TaxID=137266 RepID=A0AAE4CA64_9ACTN|nr:hypothetical protein [Catenuloplanes atrovinosus]MDR7276733.1 hypothetical protein [Catenuloplanes atrovinosus]
MEVDTGPDDVVVRLSEFRERRVRSCPAAGRCRMRPLCLSWNQCLVRSHVLAPRTA